MPERSNRRYFLAGLLAIIPLWLTWLIVAFLFKTFSAIGKPLVTWLASLAHTRYPQIETLITNSIFQAVVSFLVVVIFLYFLGVLTTNLIGRRILGYFENLLDQVPFVRHVYGAVKKLTTVLQEKPGDGVERVVLIDFPSPGNENGWSGHPGHG